MSKYRCFVIKEPIWKSVVKDSYTFGCLFGLVYANKTLLGGSRLFFWLLVLLWIDFMVKIAIREHKTPVEAMNELVKLELEERLNG